MNKPIAERLLESHKKVKGIKEDATQLDGGEQQANKNPILESISKLIKEDFSKDNDSQKAAVGELQKLAESDDELANKFMENLDQFTSGMKVVESEDGSLQIQTGDVAKKADEQPATTPAPEGEKKPDEGKK